MLKMHTVQCTVWVNEQNFLVFFDIFETNIVLKKCFGREPDKNLNNALSKQDQN